MADRNWRAGGKDLIPARALACLAAFAFPCAPAWAISDGFGSLEPNVLWEGLIGGVIVCAFLASIALWVHSARWFKRSQLRPDAFVSSALNHLNQGVVMIDSQRRVVFCNERYLEIYGLLRADVSPYMAGRQ